MSCKIYGLRKQVTAKEGSLELSGVAGREGEMETERQRERERLVICLEGFLSDVSFPFFFWFIYFSHLLFSTFLCFKVFF